MSYVRLRNVSFSYPIYNAAGRSLKLALARSVGASMSREPGVVYVDALRDISFELVPGDRLGLIGHNGAGKSSLLRLLGGLSHPDSGEIEIKGRVIPLIERGLGVNGELSGRANIELPLRLLGASSREIKAAQRDIPTWTGLGPFMDMPVRTYSEGMKSRLMFALSTAITGDLLLLDEWLGTGDAAFVIQAQARLARYMSNVGMLVLASHSLELIAQVCNKAALMENGSIVAFGETDDVIATYLHAVNASVADTAVAG